MAKWQTQDPMNDEWFDCSASSAVENLNLELNVQLVDGDPVEGVALEDREDFVDCGF